MRHRAGLLEWLRSSLNGCPYGSLHSFQLLERNHRMSALLLSLVVFLLVTGGIAGGTWLRRALPQHHLSKESQDVVKLGVGLLSTMAALVLGLLIASAKSSFDTQSQNVKQITAHLILLDNLLGEYGPDARPLRLQMRTAIGPLADRIWGEKASGTRAPFEATAVNEQIYLAVQSLVPTTDLQQTLKGRLTQIANDLIQTRMMLFVGTSDPIPAPFLIILVFWLVIIFASFSLFATLNPTVFSFLLLFGLSASCALYLILELSKPFSGLMVLSSDPLRHALLPLPL